MNGTCFFAGMKLEGNLQVIDAIIGFIDKGELHRKAFSSILDYASKEILDAARAADGCEVRNLVPSAQELKDAVSSDDLERAKRALETLKRALSHEEFGA